METKSRHNWNDYDYNRDYERDERFQSQRLGNEREPDPTDQDRSHQDRSHQDHSHQDHAGEDHLDQDKRPGVVIRPMTHYTPEPIRWLEEGRIAMGKLTLIAGDPGLGKSFMTLELAARVSRGEIGRGVMGRGVIGKGGTPNSTTQHPSPMGGRAVIMSAEDDASDTLVPRLKAMSARLSRVHFIEGVRSFDSSFVDLPQLDRDTDRLIEAIQTLDESQESPVSLIVIDPISAYMGKADSHNNAEVRSVLAQLARLAQVTGAAVVCVTHLNKDSSGKRAVYRAMGSLAFTAAARTVHLVTKYPVQDSNRHSNQVTNTAADGSGDQQDLDKHKRVVSMVKNNLGPIVPARVYVIEDGILVWLDEEMDADADALEGGSFEAGFNAIEEARAFLTDRLIGGPLQRSVIMTQSKQQGISESTLRRAKDELRVQSKRVKGVWIWSLETRGSAPTELDDNGFQLV
jgi:RecA-family ATPase